MAFRGVFRLSGCHIADVVWMQLHQAVEVNQRKTEKKSDGVGILPSGSMWILSSRTRPSWIRRSRTVARQKKRKELYIDSIHVVCDYSSRKIRIYAQCN